MNKKKSFVTPTLWLDERHWIASFNDRSPKNKESKFARIIIEGELNQERFIVEYQITHKNNKRIIQIQRKIQDIYRLAYSQNYTISYIMTPRECMALDTHLETLADQLKKSTLNEQECNVPIFEIKTNLVAWCLDQFYTIKNELNKELAERTST